MKVLLKTISAGSLSAVEREGLTPVAQSDVYSLNPESSHYSRCFLNTTLSAAYVLSGRPDKRVCFIHNLCSMRSPLTLSFMRIQLQSPNVASEKYHCAIDKIKAYSVNHTPSTRIPVPLGPIVTCQV